MKFGFDIDDTLINLREYAFHFYQKKLGRTVDIEVFHRLDRVEIHEAFGMTDDQGKSMWNSSLDIIYHTDCPTYPGAVELLQKLDAAGHEIYYITSRPGAHAERTKEWLVRQGFPVKDSHFHCGMKDSQKAEIIERLQLDYYVDDKPAVLETLTEGNTKLIVKDQSYNRHLSFPRLSHWKEFEDLMHEDMNS